MTPKEKAKELVNTLWLKIPTRYTPINEAIEQRENKTDAMSTAKQCALVAVYEIMSLESFLPKQELSCCIRYGSIEYWQQVKTEIKKL